MQHSIFLKVFIGAALGAALSLPAHAAREADLNVDLQGAAQVNINDSAQFSVVTRNEGNRRANSVELDVVIPTSMTLTAYPGECSPTPSGLLCSLGNLRKNRSHTVSFNLTAPAQPGVATLVASANTRSRESDLADNSATHVVTVVDPTPPPPPPPASFPITSQTDLQLHMCVSTSAPLVWADCTPGSLLSHMITLNTDNSVNPGVWGTWSQVASDQIVMNFFSTLDNSAMSTMSGVAVSSTCFEGTTQYHQGVGHGAWQGCKP